MIYYISAGVTIILILMGILLKRNKGIASLQVIWIWIIMAFNSGGIDFLANQEIYKGYYKTSGINDWAARTLSIYMQKLGADYWEYNAFVVTITLIIFFVIVLQNTRNVALFFSFFLVYPFCDSVIQKRFFIAFIFCIIAFVCLKNKNKFGFWTSFFIALGFHFSAVFLLVYLCMEPVVKYHKKVILLIVLVESLFLILSKEILMNINLPVSEKIAVYMTGSISVKAGILFILAQIVFIILTIIIETPGEIKFNKIKMYVGNSFAIRLNYFSIIFLPLLMLDSTFFRFYRIIMVVSYFSIINKVKSDIKHINGKEIFVYAYFIVMICFVVITNYAGDFGWKGIIETLFKNNIILNGFSI